MVSIGGASNVHYEGITVIDPANHTLTLESNINGTRDRIPNSIRWIKVIAWRPNSDATASSGWTSVKDCFLRSQDDGHYTGGALPLRRVIFWHDVNGAAFRGEFAARRFDSDNAPNVPREILIEDIDIIYARGVFGFSNEKHFGVIQGEIMQNAMLANRVRNTGQMIIFKNINVSDPRPMRSLFGMQAKAGYVGDLAGIRFENVTCAAKQTFNTGNGRWRGGLLGTNTAAYRNFVFDNVSIAGRIVDSEFFKNNTDISTNQYVYDMTYRVNHTIPSKGNTLVTSSTNGSISVGTATDGQTTVTALPMEGYKFIGWAGDLTGTNTIETITMERDKAITANFMLITYAITMTSDNGSVTYTPSQTPFLQGTEVTLTAKGNLGFAFESWNGDLTGSENPAVITMDDDKTISASYVPAETYTVNTLSTHGLIVLNPSGGIYNVGDIVEITYLKEFGYPFKEWSGDLTGFQNPKTLIIDSDKSITANSIFTGDAITSYAINCGGRDYTASDGTLFTSDSGLSQCTINNTGASITDTNDDNLFQSERWGKNMSYSFDLTNGKYTVLLMFAEIFFNNPGERSFKVFFNEEIKLDNLDIFAQAGANTSYVRTYEIFVDNGRLDIRFKAIFDNAKISAIKITPDFNGVTHKLTTNASNGTIVTNPSGSSIFMENTNVSLQANPNENYVFSQWEGDLIGTDVQASIVMNSDKLVSAEFNQTSLNLDQNNSITSKGFSLFPNPVEGGKFTIKTQGLNNGEVTVKIYNTLGRDIFMNDYTLENSQIDMEVKGLSTGVYIIQLTQDNNNFISKLVVE